MERISINPVGNPKMGKQWVKRLTMVDHSLELRESNDMFVGENLPLNTTVDLPVGTILMYYGDEGTASRMSLRIIVCRVSPDGELETLLDAKDCDEFWVKKLRIPIASLIPNNPDDPFLGGTKSH